MSCGRVDSLFKKLSTSTTLFFLNKVLKICFPGSVLFFKIFNSILFNKPIITEKHHWLLQHFKGWQIKTPEPTFDSQVATLMDFRTGQQHGTSFCYVLPLSDKEALIEYTLFTPTVLKDEQYDSELINYISNVLHLSNYEVTDTEFGVIPMTNYRFKKKEWKHY